MKEIDRRQLVLSYATFYGEPFEQFLGRAAKLGFGGIQLIPDQVPNLFSDISADRRASLGRIISEHNLKASIHNVFYDINLLSLVPTVSDFAIQTTRQIIELGLSLGIKRITAHPGYMFAGWRRDAQQSARFWESAAITLTKLSRLAKEYGVQIFLENGSYYLTTKRAKAANPLHVGVTVEEMQKAVPPLDGLGLCLDVGKARACEQPLTEFVSAFQGRIGQVQFSSVEQLLEISQFDPEEFSGTQVLEIIFEGNISALEALCERYPI